MERNDVIFQWFDGQASVCFSRNGKFFYADGELGLDEQPEHYIYILLNKDENAMCAIDYVADPLEKVIPQPNSWDDNSCKYVGAVKWTRFGEVDTFKWNKRGSAVLSEWK